MDKHVHTEMHAYRHAYKNTHTHTNAHTRIGKCSKVASERKLNCNNAETENVLWFYSEVNLFDAMD